MKRCLRCKKILDIKPGKKILNPKRKFCDRTCQTRYDALKRHKRLYGKDKKYTEERKYYFKKWYQNNRERQNRNVMNDYYRNKEAWKKRDWIDHHRQTILEFLPNKCIRCGKQVKVISQKSNYPQPKLIISKSKEAKQINRQLIKEYTKHLIGFCSKDCHRAHIRGR